jgi:hypothetical protein
MLSVAVPVVLSAFTHLWNPIGFPAIHSDEGRYLTKALHVIKEGELYEKGNYNHPFFGQLFLAGILKMIGYPDSVNPVEGDVHSIERIWLVPRVLMGLLAVVDTFLIYKIAEKRYNRNVAFIASVLFAVMPLSWMIRRTYLDSILLPFLLSSILFALYARDSKNSTNNPLAIALSGIFLGLSVLTKIPVFTMIPLVGYLIYTNSNRNLKNLGLWFIPVILIPLIWPVESIWQGHFDDWTKDVLWQTNRIYVRALDSFELLFLFDPVLLLLATAGFIFTTLKKDFFPMIWITPLVMFFAFIGYSSVNLYIPLLPAFCIAGALLVCNVAGTVGRRTELYHKYQDSSSSKYDTFPTRKGTGKLSILCQPKNEGDTRSLSKTLQAMVVTGVVIFGMTSTTMLITTNLNGPYFESASVIIQHLPDKKYNDIKNDVITKHDYNSDKVTILGLPNALLYYWMPKYIFSKDVDFLEARTFNKDKDVDFLKTRALETEKALLVVNNRLMRFLSTDKNDIERNTVEMLYNNSSAITEYNDKALDYDHNKYPYTVMKENQAIGKFVEIRSNYFQNEDV